MKRAVMTVVMLAVTAFAVSAYAGKRERDYLKNEIAPAVKAAETKFKAACGCALKITVAEATYKEVGDMHRVKSFAENVGEEGSKYCTDDESKKALCQMKSLEIRKAGEDGNVTFTFKAGKGVATTWGTSAPSFEMITAELDK